MWFVYCWRLLGLFVVCGFPRWIDFDGCLFILLWFTWFAAYVVDCVVIVCCLLV